MRSAVGGILMGLAMLVPGVSGGTMILVMGLYDEFITSIADVTRLKFTRRNITFLAIIAGGALVSLVSMAGTFREAVTDHRMAMYSLFIGMTLGGAPLLIRLIARPSPRVLLGALVGFGIILTIAVTNQEPPDKEAIRSRVDAGEFVIESNYARDVVAGAMGMSAMVLPGISGAYMLLILGRYETTLAAVDLAKRYATSMGTEGDLVTSLGVIVPVGIGSLLSLVLLSNLMKWMLRRHEAITLGMLLGFLLGSVVGIWPFDPASVASDYVGGGALFAAGFAATFLLSRIKT